MAPVPEPNLIMGVGPGTFAVGFTMILAILIALSLSIIKPRQATPICFGCALLPLIVLGFYAASPRKGDPKYANAIYDYYYPVRVTLILLLIIGSIAGVAGRILIPIIAQPKFFVPNVACRRKQLESIRSR